MSSNALLIESTYTIIDALRAALIPATNTGAKVPGLLVTKSKFYAEKYGETRYNVTYHGVSLGWVARDAFDATHWNGHVVASAVLGHHVVSSPTRIGAVEEVAWAACHRWAAEVVDAHVSLVRTVG